MIPRLSSLSTLARHAGLAALLAAALAPPASGQFGRASLNRSPITVQWLGHAAFEITSPGGTKLLIDPFLSANPSTPDSLKRLARYKPAAILVTHSHDDHALDAKAISQLSGAKVISTYEWVNAQGVPASQAMGGNVGGSFRVGDVTIHLVPAMHSSEPGGRPLGFVLEFADRRTLYHTGDTWLFGDMGLIQEIFHPNIILLGVGGGPYTQNPYTAKMAIDKYFKPQTIIPMHYGTFEGLATAAEVRLRFKGDRRVTMMTPGQTLTF